MYLLHQFLTFSEHSYQLSPSYQLAPVYGISHCARIFLLRLAVCSELEWKRPNRPGRRQPVLAWDGAKVDFPCASWGEGPVLQSLSALGLNHKCVVLVKPRDARLRNQASVTEQDVRKRFICDLPVSFPYHNRWRKQSGKGAEFHKTNISKKGVDEFSKNYLSGITKA